MSQWQTALVSLIGLLIGAGMAIAGAVYKEPTLTNMGSTIIGGALGMFVPQVQTGSRQSQPSKRPTLPQGPPPPILR